MWLRRCCRGRQRDEVSVPDIEADAAHKSCSSTGCDCSSKAVNQHSEAVANVPSGGEQPQHLPPEHEEQLTPTLPPPPRLEPLVLPPQRRLRWEQERPSVSSDDEAEEEAEQELALAIQKNSKLRFDSPRGAGALPQELSFSPTEEERAAAGGAKRLPQRSFATAEAAASSNGQLPPLPAAAAQKRSSAIPQEPDSPEADSKSKPVLPRYDVRAQGGVGQMPLARARPGSYRGRFGGQMPASEGLSFSPKKHFEEQPRGGSSAAVPLKRESHSMAPPGSGSSRPTTAGGEEFGSSSSSWRAEWTPGHVAFGTPGPPSQPAPPPVPEVLGQAADKFASAPQQQPQQQGEHLTSALRAAAALSSGGLSAAPPPLKQRGSSFYGSGSTPVPALEEQEAGGGAAPAPAPLSSPQDQDKIVKGSDFSELARAFAFLDDL
mmetsp:Transcript_30258/g.70605  ORF Transcript_30258/g.70605 Transcript_30258/m.70605 type:complete len:434 (+) Transcript_30258:66-1367(+)